MILASIVVFALLCNRLVCARRDGPGRCWRVRRSRPSLLGIRGACVFLTVFSVGVFVMLLGLPMPTLWPTSEGYGMDLLSNLAFGFSVAATLQNLFYCFIGVLLGTLIGVLPGIGPVATIAMLLPLTFDLHAGVRADHARRHLLRRAVRRLDHGDPGQPAGRSRRRSVTALDGYQMARQGRAGPALAIAAIGSFFAGTRRDAADRVVRAAAGRGRAQVRPGRIFLADGARAGRRRSCWRTARCCKALGDGRARPAAGPDRHRRQFRRAALHLRPPAAGRRHQLRRRRHGHVRHRRDHRQSRAARQDAAVVHRQDRPR